MNAQAQWEGALGSVGISALGGRVGTTVPKLTFPQLNAFQGTVKIKFL